MMLLRLVQDQLYMVLFLFVSVVMKELEDKIAEKIHERKLASEMEQ